MKKVASADTVAEFNFESGDYADFKTAAVVDGTKVSGGAYSIADSVEGADGKVLKIYTSDGQSRHLAFNDGSKWFTLEPGSYTVSYRYRTDNRRTAKSNVKLIFITDIPKTESSWIAGGQGTQVSNNLFDLEATEKDGSWNEGSQDITISGDKAVYFGIRQDNLYFDVYLDDFVITKRAVKTTTVTFETNGGSAVSSVTGNAGESFSVTDPTKSGFKFGGWYTDAGLTYEADMKYPQEDAVYYAKWIDNSSFKITFDGDFKTGTISGVGMVGGGMYNLASAPDNTSNKTLLVGADRNLYNGATRSAKFNDSKSFLTLSAGDHVVITYKYYIKDRQGDSNNTKGGFINYSASNKPELYFVENVIGSGAADIGGKRSAAYGGQPVQLVDVLNDEVGKWHTKTITVDITKSGVIGIEATYLWADVYFDDFEFKVTKPKQVTVSFDSQGGSECAAISANAGYTFTMPTPTREGYNFAGWYTEPNGGGTRASATAPQDNITYYAKWVSQNTIIIDFESGIMQGSAETVGSGFFKLTDSDASHGQSLLYQPTNALPRPRMLTEEAKVLSDSDYLITFEYNIRSLPSSSGFEFDFATNLKNVVYTDYERIANKNLLTDAVPGNDEVVGKWRKTSVIIHTPKDVGNGYLAPFGVNGTDAVIWFDNMEITRLGEDSDPILFIDYGYGGLTDVKYGKAGQKYTLGSVTRDGYNFEGWVDENGNDITTVTYPKSGVIYAYAQWFNATPRTVTFDDMPEDFQKNENGRFVTSVCYGIADGKGQNGTKALKYSKGEAGWKLQALNEGKVNFTVNKDTTYMVKLRYYREGTAGPVSVKFATANAGSWFVDCVDQSSAVKLGTETGKWQEITMFMTTKNAGALFFGVAGNANSVVYFDNIEIRELSRKEVVLTYTSEQTAESWYLVGKKGAAINAADVPVINPKNYSFAGWFTDKECTNAFKGKVFPSKSMTVYAKLTAAETFVMDFTDYPFEGDTSSCLISASVMSISRGGPSSDGDGCALLFDNTTDTQTGDGKKIILGAGATAMPLQSGLSYVITYDYYIDTPVAGGAFTFNFAESDPGNMWGYFQGFANTTQTVKFDARKAKTWYTSAMAVTASESDVSYGLAALISMSLDAKVYFDNIRVTAVKDGYSALVYASSIGNPPESKIVKTGTTVTLAKMSDVDNFKFLGWYYGEEEQIITGSFKLQKTTQLNAEFTVNRFTEGFESTKYQYEFGERAYESDWEIYDSSKKGNKAANVHGGRYSLHRIGAEPSFKAYCIHSNQNMLSYTLSSPMSYTVSMWVKIENPVHTLGAIEIMSSTKPTSPWSYEGDRYAIAAIADIADGKWHEISFTFKSATHYLSVVTPGNLSIYIDDITVKYAGDKEADSDVEFEDYIPRFLNANGTYSTGEIETLAAYEIVDGKGPVPFEYEEEPGFTSSVLFVTIIVCGAAVLLAVSGCVGVIIFKKRKAANK